MSSVVERAERMGISENSLQASDGFRMFYRSCFPPNAKGAAVFLHGMNLHSGIYMGVMRNLAHQGIASLVPDQRGRGKSVDDVWKRGDIHSLKRMVLDVVELRERHAAEMGGLPLFVGGISFGALIAMLYVREHPEGVKGVVIAGPPFGERSRRMLHAMRIFAKVSPNTAVKRAPRPEEVYLTKDAQEKMRRDPLVNNEPLRAGAAAEILDSLIDIESSLGNMTVPLLLMYGSADRLVDTKQLSMMRSRWGCEDCTVVLMNGIGHDVLSERDVIADITEGKAKGVYLTWLLRRIEQAKEDSKRTLRGS